MNRLQEASQLIQTIKDADTRMIYEQSVFPGHGMLYSLLNNIESNMRGLNIPLKSPILVNENLIKIVKIDTTPNKYIRSSDIIEPRERRRLSQDFKEIQFIRKNSQDGDNPFDEMEMNPFEQETNPFDDSGTNPFNDDDSNPFA